METTWKKSWGNVFKEKTYYDGWHNGWMEDWIEGVLGSHGVLGENDNGEGICGICIKADMSVENTLFLNTHGIGKKKTG